MKRHRNRIRKRKRSPEDLEGRCSGREADMENPSRVGVGSRGKVDSAGEQVGEDSQGGSSFRNITIEYFQSDSLNAGHADGTALWGPGGLETSDTPIAGGLDPPARASPQVHDVRHGESKGRRRGRGRKRPRHLSGKHWRHRSQALGRLRRDVIQGRTRREMVSIRLLRAQGILPPRPLLVSPPPGGRSRAHLARKCHVEQACPPPLRSRSYHRVYRQRWDRVKCAIGTSSLGPEAGLGIFLPKGGLMGERLMTYEGIPVPRSELAERSLTSAYIWIGPNDTHGVDAEAWDSCLGRYINDNFSEDTHNCKLTRWKEKWVVTALRDIEPDEELFMAYGRDFWAQRMGDLPPEARKRCGHFYGISNTYPPLLEARRAGVAAQPQGGILMVATSREWQGGEGLFAATLFPEGAELGAYQGKAISWAEASRDSYVSAFVFGDPQGDRAVDAGALDSCYARYANDGLDRGINAELIWVEGERWPILWATRKILPREEILVAYGQDFWASERRQALGQEGQARCFQAYGPPTDLPLSRTALDPDRADDHLEGMDISTGGGRTIMEWWMWKPRLGLMPPLNLRVRRIPGISWSPRARLGLRSATRAGDTAPREGSESL